MEPSCSDRFNWFTRRKGNKGIPVPHISDRLSDCCEDAFVIGSNNTMHDHDLPMNGG